MSLTNEGYCNCNIALYYASQRQMTVTRDITMNYLNNRLIRLISCYIHADHKLLQAYSSKQQWQVYVGNILNENENCIK